MTNPFDHVPRKRFTPQERAEVFVLRNGICHRCERKLGPNRCLEYAIGRVVTLQTQRRERSEERRRTKSSAQRREYR